MEWVLFQLGPRDERSAARTAAWIYLASALVLFISNLIIPVKGGEAALWIATATPALLLALGAVLVWPRFRFKVPLLMLTPLAAVGVVIFLNLATKDASAGAQVVFCLPVLFAASQLRFLGAGLAAGAAVAGDVFIVLKIAPGDSGSLDMIDVSLVVFLMTGLLVLAGRRQDNLVAKLESQASQDPLTGLVTRRVLDEALRRALSTPIVHSGTALILVDVDHFKSINDNYGHPVGDDALVHIAKLLARHARSDTVISRLGGDEIAVLLPGCTEAVARGRAQEFLDTVHNSPLVLPGGARLNISISVGVAHAPSGNWQLRELYAAADASLYEAKRGGRGRVGQAVAGHPVFEAPTSINAAASGSQRLVDGSLEMRHMPNGVLEGDVGLTGDDRIEHR